ncbi:MAG: hypothetical protein IKS39_06985 [Clostridia bacterium]|nr:hypothetical protein [Clostridia bacterium]
MRDDFNEVCNLVAVAESSIDGLLTVKETKRIVFCTVLTDQTSTKSEAGKYGVGMELKIKLPDISEYNGEKFFEYNNIRYEVIRTYRDGDMLEINGLRGVE